MRSVDDRYFLLDYYQYIKLINFIYCNAYNYGGNEYEVTIFEKPIGVVMDMCDDNIIVKNVNIR